MTATTPAVLAALVPGSVTFNATWRQQLAQALVGGYALWFDASIDPSTIDPTDATSGAVAPILLWNKGVFWYDPTDSTTAADGVTCIVTVGGKRYKIVGTIPVGSVISATTTAPPGSPSFGDSYLVPAGATGVWATHVNARAVWGGDAAWHYVAADFGPPLYVRDTDSYLHWTNGGVWEAGLGNQLYQASSIPLSALISKGLVVPVINQTQNAPPGARIASGVTPTVPLGGTAANINDNNTSTTSITSAIGDLSAAAVASRIIGKLDLGSTKNLIAVEVKQLLLSAGSSGGIGLYTSPDGTTWTLYGSTFSITTAATDFVRTGAVSARYVGVALTNGNYGTSTATLSDLNAYDGTVVASVGDAYVVGSAPFGIFAGDTGKLAICETANAFTIYTPVTGQQIYDQAQGNNFRWNGSAWTSISGAIVGGKRVRVDAQITPVHHTSAGVYTYGPTTIPTTSNNGYDEAQTLVYVASKSGADLLLSYQCFITTNSVSIGDQLEVVALFRDAESTALDFHAMDSADATTGKIAVNIEFLITAIDTASHTYSLRFMQMSGSAAVSAIERRLLRLQEFA